jgi:toxin-antitoxin system PIN domain toxin
MSSLNFLDVNVWLALSWSRHSHALRARAWFDTCEDDQFLFCRFTQLALLRLLTNRSVMGTDVRSAAGAWEIYDEWLADDRVVFVAEPSGLDPRLRSMSRSRLATPQLWADAYLAAFATSAGLRLVTFDKAFRSRPVDSLILA